MRQPRNERRIFGNHHAPGPRNRRLNPTGVLALAVSLVGGCAAPVVEDTEEVGRVVFSCPGDRTLEISRPRDGKSAIVHFDDGRLLRLARDLRI